MKNATRTELTMRLLEAMIASPNYQGVSESALVQKALSMVRDIERNEERERQSRATKQDDSAEPTASFIGKRPIAISPEAVSRLREAIERINISISRPADTDITPTP